MNKRINMYFAPYKTCNLNCQYCYVPKRYKSVAKPNRTTILDRLKQLICKIESEGYQVGAFCLHGAEPALMSADTLVEISELMKGYWKRLNCNNRSIAIQSNGIRFTEPYLAVLKSNLEKTSDVKLGFSIDPPKVIHDCFRDDSFDAVESNYLKAMEMGFPVSILSVVTNETMNYLAEFGDWIKTQIELKSKFGNPYKIKIKLASAPEMFSLKNISSFTDFLIDNHLERLIQILTPGYCLQAGNECEWYEFDIEGNCYSCNKNYNPNGVFANWMRESITEIKRKRKILFSDEPIHQDCGKCEFEMICNSGCPSDRIKLGDQKGKAHECEMIKKILVDKENKGFSFLDFYNQNN